jgi:hypothetical protein
MIHRRDKKVVGVFVRFRAYFNKDYQEYQKL